MMATSLAMYICAWSGRHPHVAQVFDGRHKSLDGDATLCRFADQDLWIEFLRPAAGRRTRKGATST